MRQCGLVTVKPCLQHNKAAPIDIIRIISTVCISNSSNVLTKDYAKENAVKFPGSGGGGATVIYRDGTPIIVAGGGGGLFAEIAINVDQPAIRSGSRWRLRILVVKLGDFINYASHNKRLL